MSTYRTREGDMLDWICLRHYGESSRFVEAVLAANPGLADLGPVYPAGVLIELPELAELPELQVQPSTLRLWD